MTLYRSMADSVAETPDFLKKKKKEKKIQVF